MNSQSKYQVIDSATDDMFGTQSQTQTGTQTPLPDSVHVPMAAPDVPTYSSVGATEFDIKLRTFIQEKQPKLYILTPCYGSMCFVDYMSCLIQTIELFRSIGFPLQVEFCKNDSLVPRARNNLIARAMNDLACTHMIFIDSDIVWSPVDILKLVLAEKDLCGGIYPLKHYYWDKLIKDPQNPYNTNIIQAWTEKKNNSQLREYVSDEHLIQHNLLRYNVNYVSNVLTIENNLTEVRHLATGFMMIRRNTITNLFKGFPSTRYVDDVSFARPGEEKYSFALFDTGVEDGHFYSEDWLFCSRWSKLGGKIYADVSINLSHIGAETYQGSFISSII